MAGASTRPAIVVLFLATVAILTLALAPAAAQTTVEPMYNTTPTGIVDNSTWMDGRDNASIHNVSSFVADLPAFIVGSGTGSQGSIPSALLTGLLVFGAVVSLTGTSRVGAVAGGVIGSSAAAALVEINLAPQWTLLVILVPIAILLAVAYIRVTR